MKNVWQLQEAKNKLSEVVREACEHGPQTITFRGKKKVVVVEAAEFEKLGKPMKGLWELIRESPLVGVDLDLERIKDYGRDIELGEE